MRSYGFMKSPLGDEARFEGISGMEEYKRDPVSPISDQGSQGSCVSQSIFELYSFYRKMKNQKVDISATFSYDRRSEKRIEGMSVREAFDIMKNEGKIFSFARIANIESIKRAIVVNGGALIAMIARSEGNSFWKGNSVLGGHAVAAISYDKEGLIFKNSWGYEYGDSGLWKIPYSEASSIIEAWTILI